MNAGLTPKQKVCFDFICDYFAKNLFSPSYDEIMAHMGLRSKSGINRLVMALVERGLVKHLPNRARSIIPCNMQHLLSPSSDWLSVSIDPDLYPAIREATGHLGVPAQELVNRMLRDALPCPSGEGSA